MNSTGATATHDMGGDGKAGSINQYVGRDALGFNLNYYHQDYKAINAGVAPFPAYRSVTNAMPDAEYRPLYNGNISSMATHIRLFDALGHVPIFYNYRYDQLNRYVKQDAYFNFNAASNSYTGWAADSTFRERVAYDANGNIQTFVRHAIGRDGALMDNLSYKYYPGTNKLRQVTDQVADNAYGSNAWDQIQDLDNQGDTSNYVYDEIGNIIQDKKEGITNIKWNVYGKIAEITRNAVLGDKVPTTRIRYSYDAQGNRISKVVEKAGTTVREFTWYVRDAQGNMIASYKATGMATDTGLDSLTVNLVNRWCMAAAGWACMPMAMVLTVDR
ncbi:hypothetical protein [Paraflavitalea speifideaquila]|uniref:hypothetical protein n=1 Tax=Paraflavitalea speifideaquila TaxID=3076558 RepID=UPI0028E1CBB6|nr:hypothetical protein [Paraflavitalea speifideiaquila]